MGSISCAIEGFYLSPEERYLALKATECSLFPRTLPYALSPLSKHSNRSAKSKCTLLGLTVSEM